MIHWWVRESEPFPKSASWPFVINKLNLNMRGKCSKNDSHVAVDISGLGERLEDRSGLQERSGTMKKKTQTKQVSATQQGKDCHIFFIKSRKKKPGAVVQGRAEQGCLRRLWKEELQPELGGLIPEVPP